MKHPIFIVSEIDGYVKTRDRYRKMFGLANPPFNCILFAILICSQTVLVMGLHKSLIPLNKSVMPMQILLFYKGRYLKSASALILNTSISNAYAI